MAFDCAIYTQTGRSPGNSSLGLGQLQTSNDSHDLVKNVLWRNSAPLTASSWAILALTFFRQGISRKWRSLGFDHDVFRLMVTMRGASSRLKLLGYLNEPRHKAELSTLAQLDWKEVDRDLRRLQRFGLVSLHAQSGTVKIYKLSEQGKILLKLILELGVIRPENGSLNSYPESNILCPDLGNPGQ